MEHLYKKDDPGRLTPRGKKAIIGYFGEGRNIICENCTASKKCDNCIDLENSIEKTPHTPRGNKVYDDETNKGLCKEDDKGCLYRVRKFLGMSQFKVKSKTKKSPKKSKSKKSPKKSKTKKSPKKLSRK